MSIIDQIAEVIGIAKGGADLVNAAIGTADKLSETLRPAGKDPALVEVSVLASGVLKQIIEAQQANLTVTRRLHELEAEVKAMNRFEAEMARYALQALPGGALVLALKPECAAGEPAHHICPACSENAKKSILQPHGRLLKCNACGAEYEAGPRPDVGGRVTTGYNSLFPYR
jgi:hypothetical protein